MKKKWILRELFNKPNFLRDFRVIVAHVHMQRRQNKKYITLIDDLSVYTGWYY